MSVHFLRYMSAAKMIFKYDEEELLYYFTADQLTRFGAGSIKKLADELAAYAENIEDFYSRIDALTSGSENSECLKILCIGAGIAKCLGWLSEESRYVSAIRENLEKTGDRASALEVEKKYCYGKSENIDTRIVFPHYVHSLRITLLLGRENETYRLLSKMFFLVPSSAGSIPDVKTALISLSAICNYKNFKERNIMQDVLDYCKFDFSDIENPEDEDFLNEMIRDWSEREFTVPEGAVKIQNGKYYFDDDFDIPEEDSTFGVPANDKGIAISEDPEHITWVNVPASVTKIGRGAFCGFPFLITIDVNADNPVFHDEDGTLFEGTILRTLPRGNDMGTYNIPGSVTQIGNEAFFGCSSLTKVNIPDSVTTIGYRAFQCCSSLNEINIPQSVTEIGEDAFSECYSLQTVYAPKDLDLSKTGIPTDAEIIRY